MIKLFVYGTLRKGYNNHNALMGEAKYVKDSETHPEYTMISLGTFPGVFLGGNTAIKGEVYDLPLLGLKRIDQLEGHPFLYKRTRIRLPDGTDCFTYLYQPPVSEKEILMYKVESGDWNNRGKLGQNQTTR